MSTRQPIISSIMIVFAAFSLCSADSVVLNDTMKKAPATPKNAGLFSLVDSVLSSA